MRQVYTQSTTIELLYMRQVQNTPIELLDMRQVYMQNTTRELLGMRQV